jgi:hypothetical protein
LQRYSIHAANAIYLLDSNHVHPHQHYPLSDTPEISAVFADLVQVFNWVTQDDGDERSGDEDDNEKEQADPQEEEDNDRGFLLHCRDMSDADLPEIPNSHDPPFMPLPISEPIVNSSPKDAKKLKYCPIIQPLLHKLLFAL